MNVKQLFCNHIWEQEDVKLLRSYDRWLFEIHPVQRINFYAIKHKCIKCQKEEIFEQKQTRDLTLDEVKKILGY